MTDVLVPLARADAADAAAGPARMPARRATTLEVRLLLLTIVLVPLGIGWVLWAAPGASADFNRRVTIAPFDVAIGALVVTWARARLRLPLPRPVASPGVVLAVASTAAFVGAFVANPSWRGVDLAARLVAGVAVCDVVRRLDPADLARVCATTVVAGVGQSLLGLAQVVHGRGFDLAPIDYDGPLFVFGDRHAARGGLSHPYHLVVFLLLALFCALVAGRHSEGRRRLLWMSAVAVLGSGMAVTFSRAMLLAVVPAAVVLAAAARRPAIGRAVRPLVLAFAVGLAGTALVVSSGWAERAGQTTAADADRGRVEKARLGLEVAQDHAVAGVGPGRYVLALEARGVPAVDLLPAHNVVVHGLAELGLLGGSVLAASLAWGAWCIVRRTGPLAIAGAWLLVPFLLLDAYAYVFPTGLVLSAAWIGLVAHPALRRASAAAHTA